MRPGQQNKRMRGRGGNNNSSHNGNRKGPNPLSRVYESNGPDVKIRGTASHIAEKYVTLARDAQSSGDPVSAEAYLQHAEHYFRLIAAAQAQLSPQQQPFFRDDGRDREEEFEEDIYVNGAPVPGLGPQPIVAPPPPVQVGPQGGREPFQGREGPGARDGREYRDGRGNPGVNGPGSGMNGPGFGNRQPSVNGNAFDEGHTEPRPEIPGAEASGPVAEGLEDREPSRRRRRGRRRSPGEAGFGGDGEQGFGEQAAGPLRPEPEDAPAASNDAFTPDNVD